MILASLILSHLLFLHFASSTSLSWYWIWHPLSGPGYQFYSGIVGDIPELAALGVLVGFIKHANCDAPRCLRYGPHRTADGHSKLCRKHHPDLPNHRLSLIEIHERHHKTRKERESVKI